MRTRAPGLTSALFLPSITLPLTCCHLIEHLRTDCAGDLLFTIKLNYTVAQLPVYHQICIGIAPAAFGAVLLYLGFV
jgi:hypothetical protein